MKTAHFQLIVLLILLLNACSPTPPAGNGTGEPPLATEPVEYAKGFEIEYYKGYKMLTVRNPWQGAHEATYRYVLTSQPDSVPPALRHETIIKTPVRRVVCLSTTHIALIDLLNETHTIKGVSGLEYVCNPEIQRTGSNSVVDVGYGSNLNYELLISLNTDLVVLYGIGSETANVINKLNEYNIPNVVNADYLETHPLGKTEWVKFMAAFYNKENVARQNFNQIAEKYHNVKHAIDTKQHSPAVLCNMPYQGTWYVPGGASYFAQLIADAGGNYLWQADTNREALVVSFEAVYEKAAAADIWLNTGNALTTKEILTVDERLGDFLPLQNGQVYNNNARLTPSGGNDFFESGIANPHRILNDLIAIFHPHLFPDYQLYYYQKVQ